MAELSLTGKLIAALPTQSGVSARSGNKWAKREYVISIPGQYERHFVFTVFGEDRLKDFNLRKDEEITVFFDIDAHEWNGRWFNEVRAYRRERVGQQQVVQQPAQQPAAHQAQSAAAPAQQPQQQTMFADNSQSDQADDLPFI